MPKKIYLAVPYSDPDSEIMRHRFELVTKMAAELMKEGCFVFSPITHGHPIAEFGGVPKSWEYWEGMCRSFIEWADEIYIHALPGWEESVGVNAEIEIAKELHKPVFIVTGGDGPLNFKRLKE